MLVWIFPENKRLFQGKDLFKRSHVLWVWGHRCFPLSDTVELTLWSSKSCRFLLSLKAVRHGWCSQSLGAAGSDAKDLSVCTQNVQPSPRMSMEMEQFAGSHIEHTHSRRRVHRNKSERDLHTKMGEAAVDKHTDWQPAGTHRPFLSLFLSFFPFLFFPVHPDVSAVLSLTSKHPAANYFSPLVPFLLRSQQIYFWYFIYLGLVW